MHYMEAIQRAQKLATATGRVHFVVYWWNDEEQEETCSVNTELPRGEDAEGMVDVLKFEPAMQPVS